MMRLVVAITVISAVLVVLWQYLRWTHIEITPVMIRSTLPWFGLVGAAYAIRQGMATPEIVDPLVRTPTAYLVAGVIVLVLWITVERIRPESKAAVTAIVGILILTIVALVTSMELQSATVQIWNGIAIGLAVAITALVWRTVRSQRAPVATGLLGASVVFAHVLDATSTGIGLEVHGTVERNPIAASIIAVGDTVALSSSGVLLFLLVKIAVALLVVTVFVESVDEKCETTAILVVTGGVGLAPAVHNLVLFSLTVA
jgi:uncharacterized membrane protein